MTDAGPRRGRIPFEPALEGLRGLALVGMLCFHAEFSWAVGGFLPIPTFFTLSGYLITLLFLVEWERSGEIRLVAFWGRRFRRLMPAALLTLLGISLFGLYVATPDQLERLREDVLWALFYLANWHFLLSNIAYAELFSAPSPVQHFWSLAIEEQFYFLFPLVVAGGLRVGAGSRAVLAGILGTLIVASVIASVVLSMGGASIDRIYYGSDTRAAELLLGALLAVALSRYEVPEGWARRNVEVFGMIAMLGMVGLWTFVTLESRWLYYGGFAAYSVLSAAVITAGVLPSGPVRFLLSGRAIRWVGRVSYGAYLFHWPVYLWLTAERTGLEQWPLFALRVAVTFGLAGISYRAFESPIRSGRLLSGWRAFVAAPAAFMAVVLAVVTVTTPSLTRSSAEAAEELEALQRFVDRIAAQTPEATDPTEAPSRFQQVPRIAVFGDSTAVVLGAGLLYWLDQDGRARARMGAGELGCALTRRGVYRFQGRELRRPSHCEEREVSWRAALARDRPDVAIALVGPWEVCDRRLPGDDQWRHLGDPVLDAYVRQELLGAADLLASDGALVIWLTHPAVEVRDPGTSQAPEVPYPESGPARMARLNELIFELETLRPGQVRVIDLAAFMRKLPGGELDPAYRPDGTHLSPPGSIELARTWLAEEVLRVYRDEASHARAD